MAVALRADRGDACDGRRGRPAAGHAGASLAPDHRRLPGALGHAREATPGPETEPVASPTPESAPAEASTATAVLTDVARVLGMGPGAGTAPNTPWAEQPDPRLGQAGRWNSARPSRSAGCSWAVPSAQPERRGRGRAASPPDAWGRFAGTTFDGRDGKLSLDGDCSRAPGPGRRMGPAAGRGGGGAQPGRRRVH